MKFSIMEEQDGSAFFKIEFDELIVLACLGLVGLMLL